MQFQSITGQEDLKKQLKDLVQQNRLSHALLFLGKEGSGALQLALALAQYLVCEKISTNNSSSTNSILFDQPSSSSSLNDACEICSACKKANQLIHPDIHFSYPVITKKSDKPPISTDFISEWREFVQQNNYGNVYDWLKHVVDKNKLVKSENKQGNISANECNDIIRKLSLKSFEGGYKILILWMPEFLGNQGNKLLKLIEEPPPNTLFILVSENDGKVLPTILSRCQLVKIPALTSKEIELALIEKNNIDSNQARQIALLSQGNYREALQFLQNAEEDWQNLLREWLNAVLKTGPIAQTKWVEEISRQGRENQKQFLLYFNHILEQAIRCKLLNDENSLPDKEKDFIVRLNKIADLSQQQAIIEELDKAMYYIERNANAKILFHALTIKLYHIIQDKIVFLTP